MASSNPGTLTASKYPSSRLAIPATVLVEYVCIFEMEADGHGVDDITQTLESHSWLSVT